MAVQENNEVEIQETKRKMLYSVDEAPFPLLWPLFGMQQILILIGGTVAVSTLVAIQLGVSDQPEIRTKLLSIALFACGLATVLQNVLGCRLPVLHGPLGASLAAVAAILSLNKWSDETLLKQIEVNNVTTTDEPWLIKMREIQGNLMLASATLFIMGITGMIGILLRFIGPLTVGPNLIITGIYIGQFAIPLCEKHWGIAFTSVALLVICVAFLPMVTIPFPVWTRQIGCHVKRLSVFKLVPLLLTICVTWLLCHVLTVTDALPSNYTLPGHMARTDVRQSAIYQAPWFYFPLPFQFGMPTVSVAGYIGLLATTISAIIKYTGEMIALSRVAEVVPPPPHAVNRGVAVLGISTAVQAMIGQLCLAFPYSQSIGAIAITKVPSRKVFITAGILMMVGGVVGKIGAVFTIIPDPVIGGVTMIAMGMVTAAGMATLQYIELNSARNHLILGASTLIGLRIPEWMSLHSNSIKSGSENFDQIATVLLSNPTVVGGFLACLLDNLIPGTEKERGITGWRQTLATSGTDYSTGEDTYELPYVTRFIRKVKCCSYCPVSPTFDNDIKCNCCAKKTSSSSCVMDNGADVNETEY